MSPPFTTLSDHCLLVSLPVLSAVAAAPAGSGTALEAPQQPQTHPPQPGATTAATVTQSPSATTRDTKHVGWQQGLPAATPTVSPTQLQHQQQHQDGTSEVAATRAAAGSNSTATAEASGNSAGVRSSLAPASTGQGPIVLSSVDDSAAAQQVLQVLDNYEFRWVLSLGTSG